MAYVSLYRKYRPQSFDDVVGQTPVIRTLANAITEDRLHHAYLFTGPRGTGKTSTARILAKAINCEQGPTPTPCNICRQCIEITNGSSVDVIELDMASHGGVDDARELRDRALFAPASARRKVYILDEVHMASTAAFNALLKLIEEPPAHVMFAMATTDPQKVLPTIMSRVQRLDLRRVSAAEVAGNVRRLCELEGYTIDAGAVEAIVRAGDGSLRDTQSVLEQVLAFAGTDVTAEAVAQVLGQTPTERVVEVVDLLATRDVGGLLAAVQGLVDEGHDLRRFTLDLVQHVRDLLVLGAAPDHPDLVDATDDRLAQLQAQATALPSETLLRAVTVLATTVSEQRLGSPRLPLELALASLVVPSESAQLDELTDRIARLEAGATPPAARGAGRAASAPRATDSAPSDPVPADPAPAPANPAPADPARQAAAAAAAAVAPEPPDPEPAPPVDPEVADPPATSADLPPRPLDDTTDAADREHPDVARETPPLPDTRGPDTTPPSAPGQDATGPSTPVGDPTGPSAPVQDATGPSTPVGDPTGPSAPAQDTADGLSDRGDAPTDATEDATVPPDDTPAEDNPPEDNPGDGTPGDELAHITQRWEAILDAVRQGSRRHHAIFLPATPVRAGRGILTLRYGRRYASFHAAKAGSNEYAAALQDAVRSVAGQRVRLEIVVEGEDDRRRPVPPSVTPEDARTAVLHGDDPEAATSTSPGPPGSGDDPAVRGDAPGAGGGTSVDRRADAPEPTPPPSHADQPTDLVEPEPVDDETAVREAEFSAEPATDPEAVGRLLADELGAELVDELPPPSER